MPASPPRFVYDNAALRATRTSVDTAAGFSTDSLVTEDKMDVHRTSGGGGNTYKFSWPTPEPISAVHFGACNFSPTTTVIVRGYSDSAFTTQTYTSGAAQYFCPAPQYTLTGFTAAQSARAYNFGGGAHARLWLPPGGSYQSLTVEVLDVNTPNLFLEVGHVFIGDYWQPADPCDYGAALTGSGMSEQLRMRNGTLKTNRGPRFDIMEFNLSFMSPADRAIMRKIQRMNGTDYPLIVSLFPGDSDLTKEDDYTLLAKFTSLTPIGSPSFGRFSNNVSLASL